MIDIRGKRKIALIELYGHSEVLYVLYRLLKDKYNLSVFTTEEIYTDAKDYFEIKLKGWYSKKKYISTENFIKKNIEILNKQHLLVFVTLSSSFQFYSRINFIPRTLVIVHNVNTTFIFFNSLWFDNSSIKRFILDLLRFLRIIIMRESIFKQKILHKVDFISFPSNNILSYAQSISKRFQLKIIEPLPFTFYENHLIRNSSKKVIISIPGRVSSKLRNYEIIYDALNEIIPTVEKKIVIQLLGGLDKKDGNQVISKMKKLENDFFELVTFEKPLSQKQFDFYLKATDFMILPINKYKQYGVNREEYGKSSISGGLNDIMRFSIPTLLVKTYKIEDFHKPLITYFKNKKELVELIRVWINEKRYIEIREIADSKLQELRESKVRERVEKIIEECILI